MYKVDSSRKLTTKLKTKKDFDNNNFMYQTKHVDFQNPSFQFADDQTVHQKQKNDIYVLLSKISPPNGIFISRGLCGFRVWLF